MNLYKLGNKSFLILVVVLVVTLFINLNKFPSLSSIFGLDLFERDIKMYSDELPTNPNWEAEMKRAQNDPKFHFMAGPKSNVIYGTGSVSIAEKGHFFIKDKFGLADYTFSTINLSYQHINFQTASYLWLENEPVFLIFDNTEKIELFFDKGEMDGKIVTYESLWGDYAERVQRKILDSKIITIEYTDKNNNKNLTEFDVEGLQWFGLERS